ncbi:MAG: GNAT family N-acetyltransferase [Bacteroides sp.]
MSQHVEGMTSGLRLRAPEVEDLPFLYQLENDPRVWDVCTVLGPLSKTALQGMVQETPMIPTATDFRYLACTVDEPAPLGVIDFFGISWLHRYASLGMIVYPPEIQGCGWGRKILSEVERFAVRRMQLRHLYLEIQEENRASQKLFLSAGYRHLGTKEAWLRNPEGGYSDLLCFQKCLESKA